MRQSEGCLSEESQHWHPPLFLHGQIDQAAKDGHDAPCPESDPEPLPPGQRLLNFHFISLRHHERVDAADIGRVMDEAIPVADPLDVLVNCIIFFLDEDGILPEYGIDLEVAHISRIVHDLQLPHYPGAASLNSHQYEQGCEDVLFHGYPILTGQGMPKLRQMPLIW